MPETGLLSNHSYLQHHLLCLLPPRDERAHSDGEFSVARCCLVQLAPQAPGRGVQKATHVSRRLSLLRVMMQNRLPLLTLFEVLTRLAPWFAKWAAKMLKGPVCDLMTLNAGYIVGIAVVYAHIHASVDDVLLGL